MKKCLLYYPGSLPTLNWLAGSVLYSDGLLSIFPNEAFYDYLLNGPANTLTDTYSEEFTARQRAVRYLIDEGLFEPILASDLLEDTSVAAYGRELTDLLSHDPDRLARRTLLRAYDHLTTDRVVYDVVTSDAHALLLQFVADTFQLDADTYREAMFDTALIDRAIWLLLRMVRENYSQKGRQIIPSTDQYDYTSVLFQQSATKIPSVRLEISKCLPVPTAEVSIETIVSFRRRNATLFAPFGRAVQEFQIGLLQAESSADRTSLILALDDTVSAIATGLCEAFRAEQLPFRRATWSSLLYLNAFGAGFAQLAGFAPEPALPPFNQPKKRSVKLIDTEVTGYIRQANRIGGVELSQVLE